MRLRQRGAVGALVVLMATAGCTSLLLQEETTFVAEEATVTDAEASAFSHNATEWQNVTRSVEAAGQEREITVSNRAEVYLNRSDTGEPAASFTVVSTPQVRLAGQEMSPAGEWSHRDLLSEFSGQFDRYGTIIDIEERETRQVRMLGQEADIRVFNATMYRDDGDAHDVVVSVVRVKHDTDYVVAIGVQGMDGTEPAASDDTIQTLVRDVAH